MRLKADVTLFVVSLLWGSAFVAQRIAGQQGSVYLFNGARFLLAVIFLLPLIWRHRPGGEQWLWMSVAGLILFIASALQQAGLKHTTAGNAGFITSLYVVMIPFLLYLGWRERPHWLSIVAVTLAGAGAFLLSTAGRFEVRPGDALEFIGALFWSFHVILLGKFASRFESIPFSAGQFLVAGLLNLTAGFFLEPLSSLGSLSLGAAIVYTAIVSIGLGYTLQVWAQKHTPPADAALILSLEAVFAVLAGWIVLGEALLPLQILGCVLILLAIVLSQAKMWGFR
jgi:drug/metabolite transporter (DMT)-like permease